MGNKLIVMMGLCVVACASETPGPSPSFDSGAEDASLPDANVDASRPTCDSDGDGVESIACGGTDCDDANANRHPGHMEVCDVLRFDEDCDPTTFGVRDADGDGTADAACCNDGPDGVAHCGRDCDDSSDAVEPGQVEACNRVDDDCDGAIDEQAQVTLYRDADGDGHGDPTQTVSGCPGMVPGYILDGTDCDDANEFRFPGRTEQCNGVDDDCVAPDDPITCACTDGEMRLCGYRNTSDATRCMPVMGTCRSGALDCPAGLLTGAEPEICNGIDDNCDGRIDVGLTAPTFPGLPAGQCYEGPGGTRGVGVCRTGTSVCTGTSGWVCTGQVTPTTASECGVDYDCDGNSYELGPTQCMPGQLRSATLCTASGIRCDQTCTASCSWPADGTCQVSPTYWQFREGSGFMDVCARPCGDAIGGACSATASCFSNMTLTGSPSINLPPGAYVAEMWMAGNPGTTVRLVAATWDGSTPLGTPVDVALTGDLHTVSIPFTVVGNVPTCAPSAAVWVMGIAPGSNPFFRVTDIVIRRVSAVTSWPG